jgi:hypothetical protein
MRVIALMGLVVLLLASAAAAGGAGSLRFEASFQIRERSEPCPPEYSGGVACYAFTSSAVVKGLGLATITQRTIVDRTAGFGLRTTGTFAVRGLGELSYEGDNSARPGRNAFDFTFSGGTGKLSGATGEGTVTNSLTQSPVAFWVASIAAPGVSFDLAPPLLNITKVTAMPSGAKLRVRIRYRVEDASRPVSLRAVIQRSVANATALRTGTVSLLLRGRTSGETIRGRLIATDSAGNVSTRAFSVRA